MEDQVWATLIGVGVGFLLSYGTSYLDRRRRCSSLLESLILEMERCCDRALWVIGGAVQAPLYRLPTEAYKVAFPYLLAEAALGNSVELVSQFFDSVGELNRGLESAHESRLHGSSENLQKDHERNKLKASNLVEPQGESGDCLSENALAAIRRQRRPWWKFW